MNKNLQVDQLVWQLVFGKVEEKKKAYEEIRKLALKKGIFPASINNFYLARGRGQLPLNFTVPAINVRGMTYDMAKTIFKTAKEKKVGALILEIARSEIGYTAQPPQEYAGVIMGAAMSSGFSGPLFIQGDHFQFKAGKKPSEPETGEIEKLKKLIQEAVLAGFYNIDIDASTLVNYSKPEIYDQQRTNFMLTAKLTEYIRKLQPKGVTVSVGGEIGHIGGKNSTEEELRAFMEGFRKTLKPGLTPLSKISIQTGTHHGGVVLADGSMAKVKVDFGCLRKLAQAAREYGMAGTVQHGASTLPESYFNEFPKNEAVEVHLATEFQNIIMNHPAFPKALLNKMYLWLDENKIQEKEKCQTQKQFHYSLRKKCWGPFKKECWFLTKEIKQAISKDLENKFRFLFRSLNVEDTQRIVSKYVKQ